MDRIIEAQNDQTMLIREQTLLIREQTALINQILSIQTSKITPTKPAKSASKSGKKWTEEDDCNLKQSFADGQTVGQLATRFERTRYAIDCRLERLGITKKRDASKIAVITSDKISSDGKQEQE